jgi:1,4-alpha-glucan branching enzyme
MAGGMASLLLAAGISGWRAGGSTPVAASPGQQPLQFVLGAPEASAVTLVGDFNDWSVSATPLRQAEGGVWTVTVPLPPGRYRYSFVVDGKVWRNDPDAASMEDEFGRPNSVVTVGGA